jgi:pimeloyl-ACP methyl ester carboxylesterase
VSAEPGHFVEVDQGRIFYRDHGDGDTVIVWVHGLPLDGSTWRAQIDHFGDCRNIAIDLRGYGRSSKLPPDASDVTAIYVDDLTRLLDHLGVGRVVIVGHASGGHGVLRFASARPERVARVVVINASPMFRKGDDWPWGFDEAAIASFRAIYDRDGLEGFIDFLLAPTFKESVSAAPPSLLAEYKALAVEAGKETLFAFFDKISCDDDRPYLKDIKAPTLLLTGLLDNEVPPPVGLYMRNTIPRAMLVEVPDADHFMFATRPLLTNALIASFLRQSFEDDTP